MTFTLIKNMEPKAFTERPAVIAHRGDRARYPENTLAAFSAAVDLGVEMIELDVMLSKDRKLVVIHDATLERTTNGKGPVRDHTLEQIRRLDAGSWFDPRFAGEPVPTLEEVLERLGDRVLINIEIKSGAYEPHHPADAIERQVARLAEQKDLGHSVLVSSFHPGILENIAGAKNAPALALISRDPAQDDPVALCLNLGAFSWHPNGRDLGEEQVKRARGEGLRVFPYNVDSPEEYHRMIRMGVDGVITSDPLMALELSAARGDGNGR